MDSDTAVRRYSSGFSEGSPFSRAIQRPRLPSWILSCREMAEGKVQDSSTTRGRYASASFCRATVVPSRASWKSCSFSPGVSAGREEKSF